MKNSINIFLLAFLFLGIAGCSNYELVPRTDKKPATIPKFEYTMMDGKTFTRDDLDKDKNTVFIYLDPECIFCQTAIQRFKRNINDFEETQFLIVSVHSQSELEKFNELHDLDDFPQMMLLRDRKDHFSSTFRTENYPVLYLYSKDGKFVKDFQGLADIDEVEAAFDNYKANVE